MNEDSSSLSETFHSYLISLYQKLDDSLTKDQYYIDNVVEFHALLGVIEILIEEKHKFKKGDYSLLDNIKNIYLDHYNKNKKDIDLIIHDALNELRADLDELVESYMWEIDYGINCDALGFDDYFLAKRDRYEFIFNTYKKITKISNEVKWVNRLNIKMHLIDDELRLILPVIYNYLISKCNFNYIYEPEKPVSFWWRKMHLDLLDH